MTKKTTLILCVLFLGLAVGSCLTSRRPDLRPLAKSHVIARAKYDGKPTRLLAFIGPPASYAIEIGDRYARFYTNGRPVLSEGKPYEIEMPYKAEDVFKVRCEQEKQSLRLSHPDYPTYRLTCSGPTNWDCTQAREPEGASNVTQ